MPGNIITSLSFTLSRGCLVYTGDIATIRPLFGMSNQLVDTFALSVGVTVIITMGRAKCAWVTAVPRIVMVPTTMSAVYFNLVSNSLPKGLYLLVSLSVVPMVLMAVVSIEAFKKCYQLLHAPEPTPAGAEKDHDPALEQAIK